jgi:hypothetical protein
MPCWFSNHGRSGHSSLRAGHFGTTPIVQIETDEDPTPVKIIVRDGHRLSVPEYVFPPKADLSKKPRVVKKAKVMTA